MFGAYCFGVFAFDSLQFQVLTHKFSSAHLTFQSVTFHDFFPKLCIVFGTVCFCVKGDLEMRRYFVQIKQHEPKRLERRAPFS